MLPSKSKTLSFQAREHIRKAYEKAKQFDDPLVRQNIICVAVEEVKRCFPNAFISDDESKELEREMAQRKRMEQNREYAIKLAKFRPEMTAFEIAHKADISTNEAKEILVQVKETRVSKARRQIDALFR